MVGTVCVFEVRDVQLSVAVVGSGASTFLLGQRWELFMFYVQGCESYGCGWKA